MPGAEIRRQRRAFIKGALRTAAVAAVVIAIIGFLAWNNARLAEQARQERDRANYEVYVASMNLMRPLWEQQNLERVQDLLTSTKDNPARGWEWDYWSRMVHPEVATYPRRTSLNWLPAYSATGKVYVRDDGKIVEYSPDTGQLVDLMPMMGQSGGYLTPIRDGKGLLEWTAGNAQVIDLPSRRRSSAKLEDIGPPGITTQFVSADGQWVVGGRASEWSSATTSYRSAVIWNTETGESKAVPTNPIRLIAVSPDARLIAAAEVDTSAPGEPVRVVVREFGSWKALDSFETLGPTTVLNFSPRGTRLATGTSTGWVQLWDLSTRREISRTQANARPVNSIEFSLDESWLATGGFDRIGRLYDVSGSQFKLLQTFPDAMQVVIQSDRARVATAYFSSYLSFRIYDPKTYIQTPTALSGFDRVDTVDVLGKKAESGESWGLTRRGDGTIEITDFDLRRTVFTLPKSDRIPIEVAQFADNRRAALSYTDKRLEIWDTVAGNVIKQIPCPGLVVFVKASPDGRWLAVSALNGALSVWDTTTWTERPLSPASGAVAMTFSSDGARLLAATANDNAEVWDTRTWKLLGKLIGHALTVEDVSYSPDGKRIVTASDDGTIRLWDPETFRELTTLTGHNQTVIRARFTDDGSSIISIDAKGNAKMWLTKTPAGLVTPAMSAQAR
jgi:WD40 repeat protein